MWVSASPSDLERVGVLAPKRREVLTLKQVEGTAEATASQKRNLPAPGVSSFRSWPGMRCLSSAWGCLPGFAEHTDTEKGNEKGRPSSVAPGRHVLGEITVLRAGVPNLLLGPRTQPPAVGISAAREGAPSGSL